MTTEQRSLPLIALVLVVAVLAANARLVIGGKTWDDARYHTEIAPPRLAAAEAVQHAALPQWWDGSGLGVPLAAEPSHGALYPPTWIAATPRSLDLLALVHLAWAALGTAVWARRRLGAKPGASEHAAVVAGLLVATSGLAASAAMRGALLGLAHLPWLGACASALGEATERRDKTRAAIAIGVLLGLVGLSGVLASLVDGVVVVATIAGRRRVIGYVLAALGSGLAIGCVQWLPAALQLGVEHGATVSALPLARLLELIVPGSFGAHDADRGIQAIAGRGAWAPSLFVGAPLLALAAVRPPARRVLALVATFGVLALVVGRGGWPAWLGAPELHLAALVVVLAGTQVASGLDALVTGERRAAVVVGVAIGCTTIALVALGVLRARNATASTAIDRALVDGCIGLLCTGVALALAIRGARRTMPIVLALLVLPSIGATGSIAPVIDRDVVVEPPAFAIAAQRSASPVAPIRVFRPKLMFDPAALAPPESLVEHRKTQLVTAREHTDDALATFANAAGARWGIANAESTDPARPAIHDRVWLAASRQGGVLLDRFGIALAILPETLVVPRGFTAVERRGEWALVTLPVAPPAAVLRGWMWSVDPDNALALLFPGAGSPLPRGTVVLRGGGTTERDHGPPLPCTIERWDAGDIALACDSDRDGYAVISSTATTGWSVTVDDADATWLTADVLRRAVAMPAGHHQIAWRYTTPGLGAGFVIACIGVMLLIALWLAGRKLLSRPRS